MRNNAITALVGKNPKQNEKNEFPPANTEAGY